MNIAVGDFVLFEYIYGREMEFKIGEVICVDTWVIVVKEDLQVTVERRDQIGFAGTRKQVAAMKIKVDAMLKKRREAMEVAQRQVSEIAGGHAGAIRTMLKQKMK